MAYGDLKGTLVGTATSITNPFNATGSVTVAVGDLLIAVIGQQTSLTTTAVTDSLGHTYTAQNAGTDSGAATGRCFWFIATSSGTLTTVSAATTASSTDGDIIAAVFSGPFNATPLDVSPANVQDITTPFTAPATGALAQAFELVLSWFTMTLGRTAAVTAPGKLAISSRSSTEGATSSVGAALSYQIVNSTVTSSTSFTTPGGTITSSVLGTLGFKFDVTDAPVPNNQDDWPFFRRKPLLPQAQLVQGRSIYSSIPPDTTTQLRSAAYNRRFSTPFAPPWVIPTNVVLNAAPPATNAPFGQDDWPPPQRQPYPISLRTWLGSTVALLNPPAVAAAPFSQDDWPNPRAPAFPITARTWLGTNTLFDATAFLPFNQDSWPNPRVTTNLTPLAFNNNLSLSTVTVAAAPFNQDSWPLPFRPVRLVSFDQQQNLNLISIVYMPARVIEWPGSITKPVIFAQQSVNLPLLSTPAVVTAPFSQDDWPKPILRKSVGQTLATGPQITPNPFKQTEWPAPTRVPSRQRTVTLAPQITPNPFKQNEWANPILRKTTGQTWISATAALLSPPFVQPPFSQTDWPLPYQPRHATSERTWISSTIGLFNQVKTDPFVQSDWPLPYPPRYPVANRTWISSTIGLRNQVRTGPFNQSSWPLPFPPRYPTANRTWQSTTIGLHYQKATFPFNQRSWPLPIPHFKRIQPTINATNASGIAPPPPPPVPGVWQGPRGYVRDYWDRDEWGRLMPGSGLREG